VYTQYEALGKIKVDEHEAYIAHAALERAARAARARSATPAHHGHWAIDAAHRLAAPIVVVGGTAVLTLLVR
jgi:hypothetical protein